MNTEEKQPIKERLAIAGKACMEAIESWEKDQKNTEAREALQSAIHEMRKVCARLEIDMAVSERDERSQKRIPIPSHRAKKGPNDHKQEEELPDFIQNGGNDNAGAAPMVEKKPSRRRTTSPRTKK